MVCPKAKHIENYRVGECEHYKREKCSFGNVTIKLDGVNELDACSYQIVEKYRNVTIEVLECKKCGYTEISWFKQDDTEEVEVE